MKNLSSDLSTASTCMRVVREQELLVAAELMVVHRPMVAAVPQAGTVVADSFFSLLIFKGGLA